MSKKIINLGKKSNKKIILMWSGILTFILNLFGCNFWEAAIYAPPFLGDFEATGTAIDKITLIPVKGIEVSVHLVDEEQYIGDYTSVNSDITDDNGDFELNVEEIYSKKFIVFFHDLDPEKNGNYTDKYIKIEMPDDKNKYIVDWEIELSEIDE